MRYFSNSETRAKIESTVDYLVHVTRYELALPARTLKVQMGDSARVIVTVRSSLENYSESRNSSRDPRVRVNKMLLMLVE